jgi:hypothetical protein
MISNVVVLVNGRKALPLRAIPYLTAWAESPDSLVRALALPARLRLEGVEFTNTRALIAYHLQPDGLPKAVPPDQWQHIANELDCLTKKLKADERPLAEGENHAAWRLQAVLTLPQNGFVWLDDFQDWYAKTRPLHLPTDDEVVRWEAELAAVCEPDELASVLSDGMPLSSKSSDLQLDVILPADLTDKLWHTANVIVEKPPQDSRNELASVLSDGMPLTSKSSDPHLEVIFPADLIDKLWHSADVINDKPQQAPGNKAPVGRPSTQDAKINAVKLIIEAYIDSKLVDDNRHRLPGLAKDVLAACQQIEMHWKPKKKLFSIAETTFKRCLAQAGYGMRPGRKSARDVSIWVQHAAEIAAKIPANIFHFN